MRSDSEAALRSANCRKPRWDSRRSAEAEAAQAQEVAAPQPGGPQVEKVNLAEKFSRFCEHWQPRVVGELNGQYVKLAKLKGPFVWHKHDETDDFFLVLSGRLTIQLRDRDVELSPGELFVVPRGVEHCPRADEEAHVLLIEPAGTPNTGDGGGERTAPERPI